ISYTEITHNPLYTIDDALNEDITSKIIGTECKNLFLKGHKGYYLVLLPATEKADFKSLAKLVKENKLSFASADELNNILNLTPGSVTTLGIINDKHNLVTLLIASVLQNKQILVHPNVNTKTMSLAFKDLLTIIEYTNHSCLLF
ncbi:MAG: prolyl-tRNA synthetase associated domain-containing protein, partial [Bacilli bacterium]|nr:prolyl-tRNA synthetase associated domain-containing protein [Bacilli bacterium]